MVTVRRVAPQKIHVVHTQQNKSLSKRTVAIRSSHDDTTRQVAMNTLHLHQRVGPSHLARQDATRARAHGLRQEAVLRLVPRHHRTDLRVGHHVVLGRLEEHGAGMSGPGSVQDVGARVRAVARATSRRTEIRILLELREAYAVQLASSRGRRVA